MLMAVTVQYIQECDVYDSDTCNVECDVYGSDDTFETVTFMTVTRAM